MQKPFHKLLHSLKSANSARGPLRRGEDNGWCEPLRLFRIESKFALTGWENVSGQARCLRTKRWERRYNSVFLALEPVPESTVEWS